MLWWGRVLKQTFIYMILYGGMPLIRSTFLMPLCSSPHRYLPIHTHIRGDVFKRRHDAPNRLYLGVIYRPSGVSSKVLPYLFLSLELNNLVTPKIKRRQARLMLALRSFIVEVSSPSPCA